MNQAEVSKLVSQLKTRVNPKLRKLSSPGGPEARLEKLRKTVTALFKHERIELNSQRADEARMYAERLISEAIRYGDCHKATMDVADFWLFEKQLVHKLFKVLVPRYENYNVSYTRLLRVPKPYQYFQHDRAVLELKGNPYPSLLQNTTSNRNLIHNVLLQEAKKAYKAKKYAEIAAKIDAAESKLVAEQPLEAQSEINSLKYNTSTATLNNTNEKQLDSAVTDTKSDDIVNNEDNSKKEESEIKNDEKKE